MRKDKRLGDILVGRGLISQEQLDEALKEQAASRMFLGDILLKKGWLKEGDLLTALGEQFGLGIESLKDKYIDWKFVKSFSPSLILDFRCFPVRADGSSVVFAITNPLDPWVLDKAREQAKGMEVEFVLVESSDMDEAVKRYKQYMRGSLLRGL